MKLRKSMTSEDVCSIAARPAQQYSKKEFQLSTHDRLC